MMIDILEYYLVLGYNGTEIVLNRNLEHNIGMRE